MQQKVMQHALVCDFPSCVRDVEKVADWALCTESDAAVVQERFSEIPLSAQLIFLPSFPSCNSLLLADPNRLR